MCFFSSPEPKAPGELIGWEGSVVRRPSVRPSSVHNFKQLSPGSTTVQRKEKCSGHIAYGNKKSSSPEPQTDDLET